MSITPNIYRTHTCGSLTAADIGSEVRVAGWVDTIRDHGGVCFIDLRDHYGKVQVVAHNTELAEGVGRETVISVSGRVIAREEETINTKLASGDIEIVMDSLTVLGKSLPMLPFEIGTSVDTREELRLKHRYLDLRNDKVHRNIVLRSEIIAHLRDKMRELGFLELQTPILTCSSPEGARDYIVPSRKFKGKFYALPQAPQIFKQLLMVSGFDRYFQVAPCFRDEDARADRSPGEFYQLDFEMAFATQEDVFAVAEAVLSDTFAKFAGDADVSKPPFTRIPYREAMLRYGTDKPDLRNPLVIEDVSEIFAESSFAAFRGQTVRAIRADACAGRPRSFFDRLGDFAVETGMKGLGYLKIGDDMSFDGPIAKFLEPADRDNLSKKCGLAPGCVLFFIAGRRDEAEKFAGIIRTELGEQLGLIDKKAFRMCFVTDFHMYERDEENGGFMFTHNPFSMPQGGMEALTGKDPLDIMAYQYDIVCNGVELSSGAVRNHDPEIMLKAFEIAGYNENDIVTKFGALYTAFKYGAPPHAGMAPGIDRIVMLLTGEQNIREVIAFPMNNNAQDALLGAPSEVTEKQLREVHIKIR